MKTSCMVIAATLLAGLVAGSVGRGVARAEPPAAKPAPPPPKKPTVTMDARFWQLNDNKWGDEIFAGNDSVPMGQALQTGNGPILVMVHIDEPAEVATLKIKQGKTVTTQKSKLVMKDTPFLIHYDNDCLPMQLTASVGKSSVTRTIAFACGE
jgi:hypothetical protein